MTIPALCQIYLLLLRRQPGEVGSEFCLKLSEGVPEAVEYPQGHQNFVQSFLNFDLCVCLYSIKKVTVRLSYYGTHLDMK